MYDAMIAHFKTLTSDELTVAIAARRRVIERSKSHFIRAQRGAELTLLQAEAARRAA